MKLFGELPQEKAMGGFIHDTNSHTSDLDRAITRLSTWLNENTKEIEEVNINTSSPHVYIQYLKQASKAIKEDIDIYYNKFKTDFI